jgi:hypothetical protein
VMQTAHILNAGDTRYINLRHILIKWVLLVAVVVLADTVDDGSNLYVFFSLFCHLFALIAVYPSKVPILRSSLLKVSISNTSLLVRGKSMMIPMMIFQAMKWVSLSKCSHPLYSSFLTPVGF